MISEIKTAATNHRIREIINKINEKTLTPRPEFQRRLVWTNTDKVKFIQTILEGYPCPEIYFADGDVDLTTGKGTQLLVDGQQRINAIYEYFTENEDLKLPTETKPYKDLSDQEKTNYLNYQIAVRDLGTLTETEIIEVFKRINSTNFALTDMEISNAVYRGFLKTFAEEKSSETFFQNNSFFKPMQIRRLGDVKYVLSIIVSMMHGYFNRDEMLEEYLKRFNEEFDIKDELNTRFDTIIKIIDDFNFDKKSRIWKQADFYTIFIELDNFVNRKKQPLKTKELKNNLTLFYDSVDEFQEESPDEEVREYYNSVLQAANNRTSRVRRGKIIQKVINGEKEYQGKLL